MEAALASCSNRAARSGLARASGGKHLEGDRAVQAGIASLVDDAHSTFAELGFDPVATDMGNHRESALRNQCNACSGSAQADGSNPHEREVAKPPTELETARAAPQASNGRF